MLAQAPVDRPVVIGRGVAVVVPAVFGGLAAMVAVTYALHPSPAVALGVGMVWALVLVFVDSAIMGAESRTSWRSRIATFGPRMFISLAAALTFAGPLVMCLYTTEIAVQLRVDQEHDLATFKQSVIGTKYDASLAADRTGIAAAQAEIDKANRAVETAQTAVLDAKHQLTCEVHGVRAGAGCSGTTGRAGDGDRAAIRRDGLDQAEARLTAAEATARRTRERWAPAIATWRAEMARLEAARDQEDAQATDRYRAATGLAARRRALDEVAAADAGVARDVWIISALLVAIDLSALGMKLTTQTPSYDRLRRSQRMAIEQQATSGDEETLADVDRQRLEREARSDVHTAWVEAHVEVTRARIRAWVTHQLRDLGMDPTTPTEEPPWTAFSESPEPRPSEPAGAAESVETLLNRSVTREAVAVPFDGRLRRAARLGTVLNILCALVVIWHTIAATGALAVLPLGLAVATVGVVATVAAKTRWFSQGSAAMQMAATAIAFGGLVAPLLALLVVVL
ncbi:DUF4407 domain-containing protein [Streptosporangiaceae bacterium NEAU-GS5]|nr:DUF4407 domain-containing protein [Streptosporangiaceae bacterium NEAU-GS5]